MCRLRAVALVISHKDIECLCFFGNISSGLSMILILNLITIAIVIVLLFCDVVGGYMIPVHGQEPLNANVSNGRALLRRYSYFDTCKSYINSTRPKQHN